MKRNNDATLRNYQLLKGEISAATFQNDFRFERKFQRLVLFLKAFEDQIVVAIKAREWTSSKTIFSLKETGRGSDFHNSRWLTIQAFAKQLNYSELQSWSSGLGTHAFYTTLHAFAKCDQQRKFLNLARKKGRRSAQFTTHNQNLKIWNWRGKQRVWVAFKIGFLFLNRSTLRSAEQKTHRLICMRSFT